MREKTLLLLFTLLLSMSCAWAQLSNMPQAPPPTSDQNGSPGQPSVASPDAVPAQPNVGTALPQSNANVQERNAVPAPALPSQQRVKRVALMDIAGQPGFNGAAFFQGFLILSHSANDTVDIFNVRQRRLIQQIKDMQGATGIAVNPKADEVYIANPDGNNIAVLSAKNWQVVRRIKTDSSPRGLLLLPEQNLLYYASWRNQTISLVDPLQGKVIRTLDVAGSPEHMAYDPQRREIFATLEAQNQVVVLDPTLKILRRYPLHASEPTGVVFDAKSNRLYIAVRYAVLALDPGSGRELGRLGAPAGVDSLVLNSDDGSLYASAEGGTVQLIRVASGQFRVEQEVATDVRGHTVAIDPETRMIFLPGGRDGRAKLLLLKQVDMGVPQLARTAAK